MLRGRDGSLTTLPSTPQEETWPALPYEGWRDTYETLHMWMQVVGKIRMALAPPVNHWWHSTLYVTSRGLTTSSIPYADHTLQMDFDFIDHVLRIQASDGKRRELALEPRTVADFYAETMSALEELHLPVKIWTTPQEVADPVPFEKDETHAAYDPDAAHRFWRALVQADRVLKRFRSSFCGKCSPVHFFWGAPDLAVTRFSGRTAPTHPGVPGVADTVTREAYSHECISAGFWPGGPTYPAAMFYSYAYPAPEGFAGARVRPGSYSNELQEFVLSYDEVRSAPDPDRALLDFLQSAYVAAAELGKWDRPSLERSGSARV